MYVSSDGFDLFRVVVPKFSVGSGDVIALNWPLPLGGKDQRHLNSALKGEIELAALKVFVRAAIHNPYEEALAAQSLTQVAEFSIGEGTTTLSSISARSQNGWESKVQDLPLFEKNLVALAKACAASKFVVFNTAGLDPKGESELLLYVLERAKQGFGFLYIRYSERKSKTEVFRSDIAVVERLNCGST